MAKDTDTKKSKSTVKDVLKLIAGLGMTGVATVRGAPALKGSIGISGKMAKHPFFRTWLGKKLKPLTRTALFGDRIAEQARRNGVAAVARDSWHQGDLQSVIRENLPKKYHGTALEKLIEKLTVADSEKLHRQKGKVRFWGAQTVPKNGKASKGTNIGARDTKMNRRMDDKVYAAKMMDRSGVKGVMPTEFSFKDKNLEDVFKQLYKQHGNKLKTRDLIAAIEKKLGQPIIVKSRSVTSSFMPTDFAKGGRRYNEQVLKGENSKGLRGGSWKAIRDAAQKNYLMQEKLQLDEFNKLEKSDLYTKIKDWIFGTIYGKSRIPQLRERKINEMRLHVINGKVLPYGSNMKWSIGYVNPFETMYRRKAEGELQKIVDKLNRSKTGRKAFDFKNSVYGVDAGFDRNGKLRIIEWNPTGNIYRHNGSAQFNMLNVRDAVESAIKNKTPFMQKLQLGLAGSGLIGGTRMATSGAKGLMDKESEDRKYVVKQAIKMACVYNDRIDAAKEMVRRSIMEKSAAPKVKGKDAWTLWNGLKNIFRGFGYGVKGVAQAGTGITRQGAKGIRSTAKAGYKGLRYASGAKARATRAQADELYRKGYNMRNRAKKKENQAVADALLRKAKFEEIPSRVVNTASLLGAGAGVAALMNGEDSIAANGF